jgi:hypothetical protein
MAEGRVVVVVEEDIDGLRRWGEGETIVIVGLALASMSVLVLVLVSWWMVVMAEGGGWWGWDGRRVSVTHRLRT